MTNGKESHQQPFGASTPKHPMNALAMGRAMLVAIVALTTAGLGGASRKAAPFAPAAGTRPAAQSSSLGALPIDAALRTRVFPLSTRTVAVSPDGRYAAYVTQDLWRARGATGETESRFTDTGNLAELAGCDVWIVDLTSSTAQNLTAGTGSSWGMAWSPDGETLAFYSDRDGRMGLWIWQQSAGLKRVSAIVPRPAFGWELPEWSSDGRRLLLKRAPASRAPAVESHSEADLTGASHVRVYSSRAEAPAATADPTLAAALSDLVEVDPRSEALVAVAQDVSVTWYAYEPRGRRVAFVAMTARDAHRTQLAYQLHAWTAAAGQRVIVADMRLEFPGIALAWAPGGGRLAFVGTVAGSASAVWFLALRDGSLRHLDLPASIRQESGFIAPVWRADANGVWLVARNRTAGDTILSVNEAERVVRIVTSPEDVQLVALWRPAHGAQDNALRARVFHTRTKQSGVYRLTQGEHWSPVFMDDTSFAPYGMLARGALSFDDTPRGSLVYAAEGAAMPPALLTRQGDGSARRVLASLDPALEGFTYGQAQLVSFTSTSGTRLQGALLLPPEEEGRKRARPYPLIVHLYAARGADNLHRFGLVSGGIGNMQVLATRGYAVLFPDVADVPGDPAATLMNSIPTAVEALARNGLVDASRVGVMGHSYGAYSTVLLLTRTSMFKAAVARGGYYNTFAQYGRLSEGGAALWTSILEGGIGRGADAWAAREAFLSQGPIFAVDKIATPLLLVHGGRDTAASPAQSEELFVGLRRLGREVEYARYEGEEHYEGRWNFQHQRDYVERMVAWFERYLGAATP